LKNRKAPARCESCCRPVICQQSAFTPGHDTLLERFDGPTTVRDYGLPENPLYRPRTGHYADLAGMAAALFESLIMNHPFIDGNKRLVFFATDVFLRLNGYKLQVDANKAHRFLIRLLENLNCTFEELLPWIRGNVIEVL